MTALLYALLFTATPSSAAPISFGCESRSGKLTLRLETEGAGVRAEVLRSTETGDFALRAPQALALRPAHAAVDGWLVWEGVSNRGQRLSLSALREQFFQSASLTTHLIVSADWTDTMEISHDLSCRRE